VETNPWEDDHFRLIKACGPGAMFTRNVRRMARKPTNRRGFTDNAESDKRSTLNKRLAEMYYMPIIGPLFFGACFTSLVRESKDCRWFVDTYISSQLIQFMREKVGFDDEDEHLRVVNIATLEQQRKDISVKILYKDGSQKIVDDVPGDMKVDTFVTHLMQQPDMSLENIELMEFGEEDGAVAESAALLSFSPPPSSHPSPSTSSSSSDTSTLALAWQRSLWVTKDKDHDSYDDNDKAGDSTQEALVQDIVYAAGRSQVALSDARLTQGVLEGKVRLDPRAGHEESERHKAARIASTEAKLQALEQERVSAAGRPIDKVDADIKEAKAELRRVTGSWF